MTRETEDLLQRVLAELLWLLHAERDDRERDDYEYRRDDHLARLGYPPPRRRR